MGLLNWLTDKKREQLMDISPLTDKGVSVKELHLIKQIHTEFDEAQDKLLKEALEVLKQEDELEVKSIQDVNQRLKSLGFVNTPTAIKAREIEHELRQSKLDAELIKYYSQTYPLLKFITILELQRICGKYNLIHMEVGKYIKEVPDKNLREIQNAQPLKDEDSNDYYLIRGYKDLVSLEKNRHNEYIRQLRDLDSKHKLQIAAPKSHFNLENMTKTSEFGYTEVKDPIVFRYVRGGIQILSKWGIEGNDPSLVVPKLN